MVLEVWRVNEPESRDEFSTSTRRWSTSLRLGEAYNRILYRVRMLYSARGTSDVPQLWAVVELERSE